LRLVFEMDRRGHGTVTRLATNLDKWSRKLRIRSIPARTMPMSGSIP
jgi:hypothetical protein